MLKIKFTPPGKDKPGFLRRMERALYFQEIANDTSKITAKYVSEIVEFLLPFVTEPKSREKAREALYDATQEQFTELFKSMTGETEEVIPPEKPAD